MQYKDTYKNAHWRKSYWLKLLWTGDGDDNCVYLVTLLPQGGPHFFLHSILCPVKVDRHNCVYVILLSNLTLLKRVKLPGGGPGPLAHPFMCDSHISSPQTTVNPTCLLSVCYSISSAEGRSPWLNSWHAKYLALLSLPEAGHQLAPQLCILDFIINYREGTALCASVKSKHRSRWLQLV